MDERKTESEDLPLLEDSLPTTSVLRQSRREGAEKQNNSNVSSTATMQDDGKAQRRIPESLHGENEKTQNSFASLHAFYRKVCKDPKPYTESPHTSSFFQSRSPGRGFALTKTFPQLAPAASSRSPLTSSAPGSPESKDSLRFATATGSSAPSNSPRRGSPRVMKQAETFLNYPPSLGGACLPTYHNAPPRSARTEPTLKVGGETLRAPRASRTTSDVPPAETTQFLKGFRLQVSQAMSPRYSSNTGSWYAQGTGLYPDVEITVKVYNVSNFELRDQRFYADFVLMCDWIDPQLIGQDPKTVNLAAHFCPQVMVHNALSDFEMVPDSGGNPAAVKLFDADLGWMKWTQRFRGGLSTGELNCTTYPFESQALPIVFKAKKLNGEFLTLAHPRLRRLYDEQFEHGHVVDAGGSQLTEYTLTGITGLEPRHKGHPAERTDSYEVKIIVKRHWDNVVWNILFPMFLLTMLSFVVYFIDIKDLPNRFQVTLTLLLTVIAFKLSTRELLPAVSYLTVMDHYIIHSILIFWSNGWEHAIVTQLNLRMGHEVARAVEITWLSFTVVGSFVCHLWLLWNWWVGSRDHVNPLDVLGTSGLSSGWFRRKKRQRPMCFLSQPPEVVSNVKSTTKAKLS